jgi:hypothetical protein
MELQLSQTDRVDARQPFEILPIRDTITAWWRAYGSAACILLPGMISTILVPYTTPLVPSSVCASLGIAFKHYKDGSHFHFFRFDYHLSIYVTSRICNEYRDYPRYLVVLA